MWCFFGVSLPSASCASAASTALGPSTSSSDCNIIVHPFGKTALCTFNSPGLKNKPPNTGTTLRICPFGRWMTSAISSGVCEAGAVFKASSYKHLISNEEISSIYQRHDCDRCRGVVLPHCGEPTGRHSVRSDCQVAVRSVVQSRR
mgnify:CR=1 FL=1